MLALAFVFPEYLEIAATPSSETVDPELVERGASWRTLSWIRGAVYFALAFLPIVALTRSGRSSTTG